MPVNFLVASYQRCLASDITEWIGLPKATSQNVLAKLKAAKLVGYRPIGAWGTDGRNRPLCLTTLGAKKLQKAFVTWEHALNKALRVVEQPLVNNLAKTLRDLHSVPPRLRRLFDLEDNKDWKHIRPVLEK